MNLLFYSREISAKTAMRKPCFENDDVPTNADRALLVNRSYQCLIQFLTINKSRSFRKCEVFSFINNTLNERNQINLKSNFKKNY